MKFGQLVEYHTRIISLQKPYKRRGRETISDLFLYFKKALYEVKAGSLRFSFSICQ